MVGVAPPLERAHWFPVTTPPQGVTRKRQTNPDGNQCDALPVCRSRGLAASGMPTELGELGLVADDVRVAVFEDHLVGLWLLSGRCRVVEGHDA